jgi:predicted nuclease with TOPRIM domain
MKIIILAICTGLVLAANVSAGEIDVVSKLGNIAAEYDRMALENKALAGELNAAAIQRTKLQADNAELKKTVIMLTEELQDLKTRLLGMETLMNMEAALADVKNILSEKGKTFNKEYKEKMKNLATDLHKLQTLQDNK